jgi:hypothetical protein
MAEENRNKHGLFEHAKNLAIVILAILICISFYPQLASLIKYQAWYNKKQFFEIELGSRYTGIEGGDEITETTFKQHLLIGANGKNITVRIYKNNDLFISLPTDSNEEYPNWIPSKKTAQNLEKQLISLKAIINFIIPDSWAQENPPLGIGFTDIFIEWIQPNRIAKYHRHFQNDEVWEYLYDIPNQRIYNFKKIQ